MILSESQLEGGKGATSRIDQIGKEDPYGIFIPSPGFRAMDYYVAFLAGLLTGITVKSPLIWTIILKVLATNEKLGKFLELVDGAPPNGTEQSRAVERIRRAFKITTRAFEIAMSETTTREPLADEDKID